MGRAEDIEDIRALTHRYAKGVDLYDPELILSVFTEDATLDAHDHEPPHRFV
jgi:hypothetical protein